MVSSQTLFILEELDEEEDVGRNRTQDEDYAPSVVKSTVVSLDPQNSAEPESPLTEKKPRGRPKGIAIQPP